MTTIANVMGTLSLITGCLVLLTIIGCGIYISCHYCLVKLAVLQPQLGEVAAKSQDRATVDIGAALS